MTDEELDIIELRLEDNAIEDLRCMAPDTGTRQKLAEDVAEQAAVMLSSDTPIYVTRIGKWVIRVSGSQEEAEEDANGILLSLRALQSDARALLEELRKTRSKV